mmetsp:Transcript_11752/g.19233  ORF Transcript_11752/g.19233 Transcript_11752/m.19233 type:complete len:423 (-) Transcript_11752:170-1438(-)|eukprot:scaffold6785_cov166-Skeletonema_menzelii.AAC.1
MTTEGGDWPPEIEKKFERIRPLGQGAFGIVWLSKSKNKADNDDDYVDSDAKYAAKKHPTYVAIKQIHASNEEEILYAQREIAILSEIEHPNIVRCLQSVEMKDGRLVVLTLADGPNLGGLVDAGGALGVSLARLAARHLISAVSYLHGRGVIHRDIKPDNCIIVKTDESLIHNQAKEDWMTNDALWDDKAEFTNEWKIVLVDFGFAKALTPKEVGLERKTHRQASVRSFVQRTIEDKGKAVTIENNNSTRSPLKYHHAMSAIGTRMFTAPEVQKVRNKTEGDTALSECVADYGLVADAYSVGATIKMILTGVPAGESEMAFISANDSSIGKILDAMCGCGKKSDGKRRKRYKFMDETPKPARELIGKLLKVKEEERLTVPLAREEPWIKGGIDKDDPVIELPEGDITVGNEEPIVCLKCAGN